MPFLFYVVAAGLTVVVTTGAVLDGLNAQRSTRVKVWTGLFLLPFGLLALLIFLIFFLLFLFGPGKWPC